MKSLSCAALIKAMVAGEMDPKFAVELFANTYQSLDSKRVVTAGGQGDPWSKLRVKMKGCRGDERGKRKREATVKERDRVP